MLGFICVSSWRSLWRETTGSHHDELEGKFLNSDQGLVKPSLAISNPSPKDVTPGLRPSQGSVRTMYCPCRAKKWPWCALVQVRCALLFFS